MPRLWVAASLFGLAALSMFAPSLVDTFITMQYSRVSTPTTELMQMLAPVPIAATWFWLFWREYRSAAHRKSALVPAADSIRPLLSRMAGNYSRMRPVFQLVRWSSPLTWKRELAPVRTRGFESRGTPSRQLQLTLDSNPRISTAILCRAPNGQ
jgi:hypothetical protein